MGVKDYLRSLYFSFLILGNSGCMSRASNASNTHTVAQKDTLDPSIIRTAPVGECHEPSLEYPQAPLKLISEHSPGGISKPVWVLDANRKRWLYKREQRDLLRSRKNARDRSKLFPYLQSSAEIISALIYRVLGYRAPIIVRFDPALFPGFHYHRKAIELGAQAILVKGFEGATSRNLKYKDLPDTDWFDALRIVADYLKDWDRLNNMANTIRLPGGKLALVDFGGSLGANPGGGHKMSFVRFDEIGGFSKDETGYASLGRILTFLNHSSPYRHPWEEVSQSTTESAIRLIEKCLTDTIIDQIVNFASFPRVELSKEMKDVLKYRRDTLRR